MADVTFVNLNMLYLRFLERTEREVQLPLGPLYCAASLEAAGFQVDFRDYQTCERPDPFTEDAIVNFMADPAPIFMVSCMANLLPFTLLALRRFKACHPDVCLVLGGVGAFSVERLVLERCPWIDAIGIGEGERTVVELVRAVQGGRSLAGSVRRDLTGVNGIAWHDGISARVNPPALRIQDLDALPPPAYHLVDLPRYAGINIISSRGCPFDCSFCSVAPVWGRRPVLRSARSIVAEMTELHVRTGSDLFLFQDEYFVASPERARELSRAILDSGLKVRWKAFGRVNLTDVATMEAMREAGCVEIRYGIESASDRVLSRVVKGFDSENALRVISEAVGIFPAVDAFYMWGFPFETMADFEETLLQMITVRTMGARVLPSMLCLLPQTPLYQELRKSSTLEFCPELFPEYMFTGHEVRVDGSIHIPPEHAAIYAFIQGNPDLFPGFFHIDVTGNILPKYALLQKFGFYAQSPGHQMQTACCGGHSPA